MRSHLEKSRIRPPGQGALRGLGSRLGGLLAGVALGLAGCSSPDTVSAPGPSLLPQAVAPCTGCQSYTGTIAVPGSAQFQPTGGSYAEGLSGTHKGWLVGPAGADFALQLMKWDAGNARWVAVRTANVAGSATESLSYTGTPGKYRWRISSVVGTGAYQFWMQTPSMQPPPPPPGGVQYRSLSAAGNNACAVSTSGAAYCWGYGPWGQLGNGSVTDWANVPVQVAGGPWDTIAVSANTTCGLKSGAAFCWGSDLWGALGTGTVLTVCPSTMASGSGCSLLPVPVTGAHSFVRLTAAGNADRQVQPPYARFACGIESSGKAFCWGGDGDGELGDGIQYPLDNPTPRPVAGGIAFAQISAGFDDACGISTTGQAWCWGSELMGELGNDAPAPTSVSTPYGVVTPPARVLGGLLFRSIDGGKLHTCGVTTAGRVYCWGSGGNGRLGTTQVPECSSDPRYPLPCSPVPVPVASNETFVQVTAGIDHTCALSTTGAIWCWGLGNNVGAGNPSALPGTFSCYSTTKRFPTYCTAIPARVASNLTFRQVDAGADFTCALATTAKVYCWGQDFYGLAKTASAELVPTLINEP